MLKPEFKNILDTIMTSQQSDQLCHAILNTSASTSIRLNPQKKADTQPWHNIVEASVPWSLDMGLYLNSRPSFTADPLLHGGAYYVQEASSMSIGWIIDQIRKQEITTKADAWPSLALDLCAAPGGKSTLISSLIAQNNGVMVANEVIKARSKILAENVQKWGSGNIAVTSGDACEFGQSMPSHFDLILVDAPCSGEGMFRKDAAARDEWSTENVEICTQRSRRIVADVWPALEVGGVMIYSTCTFNPYENEQTVEWICQTLGGQLLELGEMNQNIGEPLKKGCYRFYPSHVKGEGFFVAAILKTEEVYEHGSENDKFSAFDHKTENSDHKSKYKNAKQKGASKKSQNNNQKNNKSSMLAPASKTQESELRKYVEDQGMVFRSVSDMFYGFSPEMLDLVESLRSSGIHLLYSGVMMGEIIRDALIKPAHSLALYHGLNKSAISITELDYEQAMEYLRKGNIKAEDYSMGLSLVQHQGIGIGWAKRIDNRCNNLYPSNWRILNF